MEEKIDLIITELSQTKRNLLDLIRQGELKDTQVPIIKKQISQIKKMQSDLLNIDDYEDTKP